MKILISIIVFAFSLNAETEQIQKGDFESLECTGGNAFGLSKFTYNSYMGFLSTYRVSIMESPTNIYEIISVDGKEKFGTSQFEYGKINFKGINTSTRSYHVLLTHTPLVRGTKTYTATWGRPLPGSVFSGPAGFMPIANLVCEIKIL